MSGSAAKTIVIETELTERGYRGVLVHLAALRLRFVPLAVGVAGMLAYGGGMRNEAMGLFGALIAIPVVLWAYLSWLTGSPSSRPLYVPVRYTFSVEEVRYESGEGDGIMTWDDVDRWRDAADHLLLYVTGSRFLAIPVADMPGETLHELEQLLRDKLGEPRGRRTSLR